MCVCVCVINIVYHAWSSLAVPVNGIIGMYKLLSLATSTQKSVNRVNRQLLVAS